MKCPKYGTEFDEGIFCPECGTPISQPSKEEPSNPISSNTEKSKPDAEIPTPPSSPSEPPKRKPIKTPSEKKYDKWSMIFGIVALVTMGALIVPEILGFHYAAKANKTGTTSKKSKIGTICSALSVLILFAVFLSSSENAFLTSALTFIGAGFIIAFWYFLARFVVHLLKRESKKKDAIFMAVTLIIGIVIMMLAMETDPQARCKHEYTTTKDVQPTCTEDGEIIKECSLCGKKVDTVLPATGHTMVEISRTADTTTSRCSVCGYESTTKLSSSSTSAVSQTTLVSSDPLTQSDIYALVDEELQSNDYIHGRITQNAKDFINQNSSIFEEKTYQSAFPYLNYPNQDFKYNYIMGKDEKYCNELFFAKASTIDDENLGVKVTTLPDGSKITEGLMGLEPTLADGIFADDGALVYFFYADEFLPPENGLVAFTAVPLCAGNLVLDDGSEEECLFIACSFMIDGMDFNDTDRIISNDSHTSKTPDEIINEVKNSWYQDNTDVLFGDEFEVLLTNPKWTYDSTLNRVELTGTYTAYDYPWHGIAMPSDTESDTVEKELHIYFEKINGTGRWTPHFDDNYPNDDYPPEEYQEFEVPGRDDDRMHGLMADVLQYYADTGHYI